MLNLIQMSILGLVHIYMCIYHRSVCAECNSNVQSTLWHLCMCKNVKVQIATLKKLYFFCANKYKWAWNDKHSSIRADELFKSLNNRLPVTTHLIFSSSPSAHLPSFLPSSSLTMSVSIATVFAAPLPADEAQCHQTGERRSSCSSYHCRDGWTWWSSLSTLIYWSIQSGRAKK